jgi:putative ABC transport system substrate-binding protein
MKLPRRNFLHLLAGAAALLALSRIAGGADLSEPAGASDRAIRARWRHRSRRASNGTMVIRAARPGAAAAWPLAARAQQPSMPVIGWLSSASRDVDDVRRLAPFREGMSEVGYTEGRNVVIEYRGADYQLDRLPALAADLARRQVSLIVAGGSPASALAAKSATATIPIVFANAADPVQIGLVASINRPGGNVTGFTELGADLGAKRMGLLRELVPSATSIAILVNPTRPGVDAQSTQAQEAAQALGLQLHILNASREPDFGAAFLKLVQLQAGGLVISADALFSDRRDEIIALAKHYSVPTMYEWRDAVAAGGLISYGTRRADAYRQIGILAGRILKGEKPGDLPILQPTKFELVINMNTAKTLGLTVPPGVLAIADEVIE